MSLKNLTQQELIESTRAALKVVRQAEVSVLHHFHEIEARKLWTGAGSLYKYLAITFSLTPDQIYPRLQAMRLMQALPEVEQKIASGKLSVTNALKAQQAFAAESKQRLVSLQERREVVESLSMASTKQAEKILANKYPAGQAPAERVKPVAKNQNLIQFYVDDETLKAIEELKAKYSHQMPSGKMEDLIKILIQREHRAIKPRSRSASTVRSRYIPAPVKRELEKVRARGCNHIDAASGQRCGSKYFLQMDHIEPYSLGGGNVAGNMQWLCGFHNRFKTRSGASRKEAANLRPLTKTSSLW